MSAHLRIEQPAAIITSLPSAFYVRPRQIATPVKPKTATPSKSVKAETAPDIHYQNLMMAWKAAKVEVANQHRKLKAGKALDREDMQKLELRLSILKNTVSPAIGMRHTELAAKAARYAYNCEKNWLKKNDTNLLQTIFTSAFLLKESDPNLSRVMLNFIGRNTSRRSDEHKNAKKAHDALIETMQDQEASIPKGPWYHSRKKSLQLDLAA